MKRHAHFHRAEPSWPDSFVSDTEAAFKRESASLFEQMGTPSSFYSNLEAFSSAASASSSTSMSPPMFTYSQKNFHISDGNLYSVLSPFQARRSSARPSFLRGQSCVTTCTSACSSTSDRNSTYTFTSSSSRMDPHASRHSSKLKFHHSDLSGPFKSTFRSSSDGTGEHPSQGDAEEPVNVDDYCSSLRFSRFKSSPTFVHKSIPSFCSEDGTESLLSKRLKCRQDRVRVKTSSDSTDDDSRSFGNLLQHSKWDKDLRSKGAYHATACQGLVSPTKWAKEWLEGHDDDDDDDGDIDVDVDGALNLCMADRIKKTIYQPSPKGSVEKKRESHPKDQGHGPVDSHSIEDFVCQKTFEFSKFLNEDVPMNSKLKFDQCEVLDDEGLVLDLSTKKRPDRTGSHITPIMHKDGIEDAVPKSLPSIEIHRMSEGDLKTNRFAPISELLKNMRLQDDDFRQNTLNRYHAAREKLMETHSDMFGGWAIDRPEPHQRSKPPVVDSVKPSTTFPGDTSKAQLRRPRSWDDTCGPLKPMGLTLPGMEDSRPESAEPCLESVPLYTQNQYDIASGPSPMQMGHCVPIPMLTVPDQGLLAEDQCDEQQCWSLDSSASHLSSKVLKQSKGQSDCQGSKLKQLESKMRSELYNATRVPSTSRKSTPSTSSETARGQYPNDISICKFKLIKGVHPVLEKKKSFFVPMPRGSLSPKSPAFVPRVDDMASENSSDVPVHANELQSPAFSVQSSSSQSSMASGATSLPDRFRMYKIHIGSQEDVGKKLVAGKRLRRRSRKALVREKLEATFREQGFLIKTQQVSSAEGAVYCKFRQLKKFTRYLYKSWKDHLPKELDDIAKTSSCYTNDPFTS